MFNVKTSTIWVFVNSLAEVMINDPHRITIGRDRIDDTKTGLKVTICNSSQWIMYIPGYKRIYLLDDQKVKLQKAINDREDFELIRIHERLYKDDQSSIAFSEIQKMRKTTPMVEEA